MIRFFKFATIQSRLRVVFLTFVCLFVLCVLATSYRLAAQKQDARLINLAGRQRMLLQQMAGLASGYNGDQADQTAADLQAAVTAFDQTLVVLQNGGTITAPGGGELKLDRPRDPNLLGELEALSRAWAMYRKDLDLLPADEQASTGLVKGSIQAQTAAITAQADRVVQALEDASTAKTTWLLTFQIVFLFAGLALLGVGRVIASKSVVAPLAQLAEAAMRMEAGDLQTPVPPQEPQEVQILGATMEALRIQTLQANLDLQRWAATLESRVQQRTKELEALTAVGREISSRLSIDEVLHSVAEKAQQLSGSEVASLCLLDEQGEILRLHAARGPEAAIRQSSSPADGVQIGDVLRQTRTQACGLQGCAGFCQVISPMYRASHLVMPLRMGDHVTGALCVGSSQPDAFRPETASVLTHLAGIAAVALENSRVYQQSQQAAILEERRRMMGEMHDGLLQTLSHMGMMVGWAKEQMAQGEWEKSLGTLQQIERAEEQAELEIRCAIASLQDDFPLNVTFQEQLSVLTVELSKPDQRVNFETDVVIPLVLPKSQSEQALRIAREAIINALRHSCADEVWVTVTKQQDAISLTVQDQGVGFDPEVEPSDGSAHFGLKIMRARAARLGGELTIQSAAGAGAQVNLRWAPGSVPAPVEEP